MRPQRLGRYELLRHLASGGMAHVYLARTTGPGGFERHVVVKAIPPERRGDDSFVAMFLDEARLVAMLHHQHIGQVFEAGHADDGTYFLAMEYVHGETVRQVLESADQRKLRLPLELSLSIVCAAASALHYAHERRGSDGQLLGIVHRDVSPSNVMLGYDGSIKLIDFGIAKARLRTTETAAGFIKGKAGYMAPEQARGYAVDRRSDVFALGVLAYELTTQTRALQADTQFETMRRTVHGEIEPPSRRVAGYPAELEDVVMTALELDPDDRFQDAEAMRVALEQVARELGLALGDAAVIRALESLFAPRPEPWLLPADDADEDETTTVRDGSNPAIPIVSPRTPTSTRLARGTEAPPVEGRSATAAPLVDLLELLDLTTEPFERNPPPRNSLASAMPRDPSGSVVAGDQAASVVAREQSASTGALGEHEALLPRVSRRSTPRGGVQAPTRSATASLGVPRSSGTLPPPPSGELPLPPPCRTPVPGVLIAAVPPPPIVTQQAVPAVTSAPEPDVAAMRLRAPVQLRALIAAGVALLAGAVIAIVVVSEPARDRSPATPAPAVELPVPQPVRPAPAPAPPPQPAPRAPAASPPGTVMLHVTTEPDGATVVLDGVRLGITPFSAPVPAKPGAWLKVRKKNFAAVRIRVSLDQPVDWNVALRALAQ